MLRKHTITTGEIYHICNRSTEGISLFKNSFYAKHFLRVLNINNADGLGARGFLRRPQQMQLEINNPLVEVYAATLMSNHFHILVKQLVDNGIARWMQRSCNSFAKIFNLTENRKGALFMGRFQAVPVLDDRQLFHLFVYIHANPLDMLFPEWRSGNVKNIKKALEFLRDYKWSSMKLYLDNYGETKAPRDLENLVNIKLFKRFLQERGGLEKSIREWGERNFEDIKHLSLEN